MLPSSEVPQKHFNSSKEKQRAQAIAAIFTTVLLRSTCKTGENQCPLPVSNSNTKKETPVPIQLI